MALCVSTDEKMHHTDYHLDTWLKRRRLDLVVARELDGITCRYEVNT